MKYIILLRGINISGKNKISMVDLKKVLAKEYQNVSTYLNSGNIIIESNKSKELIKEEITKIIKEEFKLDIPIFITDVEELKDVLNNKPSWWDSGNKEIYDNLIFLIDSTKFKEVYDVIGEPKEDVEKIAEYNNTIFWSFELKNYRKSIWWHKTISTNIAPKITIRTANTMKKLLEICKKYRKTDFND